MAADFNTFRDAIHQLHGVEAKWIESVPVSDTFEGGKAWNGVVEVFDVTGHQQARRAFAWSHQSDKGTKILAVLAIPPIHQPRDAVRAAIAADRGE
jgi:hypothetical protein